MAETNEDIIRQNLNIYKGKELEIEGKYIQNNHIDKIFESLFQNDNKKILVTSVTGSGKTYSFLKNVQKNEIKTIFLAPYKSTTWQTSVSYKHENTVGFWGDKSVDLTGDETVIIATYDKSKQISEQIDCSDFTLIIDESHNSIGQYGFRKEAIKNVNKLSEVVENIIHITATPVGLNPKYDMIYNFKKEKTLEQAVIVNSNQLSDLISFLKDNKKENHLDIIRINNKKKQQIIKDTLVKDDFYSKEEILIFNSDVKGNSEFRNLINNDKINKKIRLVLTTSLIDDGVNIKNKNINNIYYFGSLDFNAIVQFPNRNRNGFNTMFLFGKHNNDREAFNINERFNYLYNADKETIGRYNNVLKELNYSPENKKKENELSSLINSITKTLETLDSNFVSLDKKKNIYYIDKNKISLRVYQKLNGTLSNHDILETVLNEYAGFKNVKKINQSNNKNYSSEKKQEMKKALKSILKDPNINREIAVKRLVQWSDISVNINLSEPDNEINRIEDKYFKLSEIASTQKRAVNKLGRLYSILNKAKMNQNVVQNVLELYEKNITPKTLDARIGFAIIINSPSIIKKIDPIKSKKLDEILALEYTTKTNSKLKTILNEITGKWIKSPKVFLAKFFEIDTTTKRDKNGKSKRFTVIKNRIKIDNIYGIDFSYILKRLNKDQLSKWSNHNFSLLAA
ncbi:type III restriction/modification enzyme restriction subunit [Halanaerobium saccharolyticum]|uniref:Type III restriction/modification enzyme restriction subunit n=1 Tax=Halanaerobium saccharolyticum TaxID=43595 RepID=A0A4R6LMS5_9FIRM|nr:DEAD/DEAH box helicase family protein [Halanaerobium saccharolyticum]TDO86475.1 type III restriction/modification enzyme restriction subunit [Halanaerobium saccharolyticum]